MRLQEPIQMQPDARQPVHYPHEVRAASAGHHLRLDESPAEKASEKSAHRLDVVRAEDPAEVVVELEIGGGGGTAGGGGLVHRTDDVWTAATRTNISYRKFYLRLILNFKFIIF